MLHLKSLSREDAGAVLECRADNGGGDSGDRRRSNPVTSRVVIDMIREFTTSNAWQLHLWWEGKWYPTTDGSRGDKKKLLQTLEGPSNPTSNGGVQNGSSVGTRTRCVHVFARLSADSYTQSAIVKQKYCIGAQAEVYLGSVVGWVVSFWELRREFIKSLLLVV